MSDTELTTLREEEWLREGRTVYVLGEQRNHRGQWVPCNRFSITVVGGFTEDKPTPDAELDAITAQVQSIPALLASEARVKELEGALREVARRSGFYATAEFRCTHPGCTLESVDGCRNCGAARCARHRDEPHVYPCVPELVFCPNAYLSGGSEHGSVCKCAQPTPEVKNG